MAGATRRAAATTAWATRPPAATSAAAAAAAASRPPPHTPRGPLVSTPIAYTTSPECWPIPISKSVARSFLEKNMPMRGIVIKKKIKSFDINFQRHIPTDRHYPYITRNGDKSVYLRDKNLIIVMVAYRHGFPPR